MLLFVCMSFYQLVSYINIKINLYPDTPADIVFTRVADFSECAEALNKTGIFNEVIMSEWGEQGRRGHLGSSLRENTEIMKKAPHHHLALKTGKKYTDIYVFGVMHSYIYLIYYQMVAEGVIPTVHLVEDGSSSYIEDIIFVDKSNIDHNVFQQEKRIVNNIKESLLYIPELFSNPRILLPHNPLPRGDEELKRLVPYFKAVFGEFKLPEEKYIFFDETFALEGRNSNEIEILDRIAEQVGKDNIIVKIHPRSKYDLYSFHGYKTFTTKGVPWEIYASLDEIDNKVLISVSSTTVLSPYIVFNKRVNSILLYKVMKMSVRGHIESAPKAAEAFYQKAYRILNSEEKQLFIPNTMNELDCYIKYLEGELI